MGEPRVDPLWSYFRGWSLMPAGEHPNAWQEATALTTHPPIQISGSPWGFSKFLTINGESGSPVHTRLSVVHPYTSDAYLQAVRDRLPSLQASAARLRKKHPELARLVAEDVNTLSTILDSNLSPAEEGATVFAHVEPRRVLASSLSDAQAAADNESSVARAAKAFVNPKVRRAFGIAVALALVIGGLGLLQISSFAEDRAA